LFGDKNHKAFSRFCLCGHEKSGLEVASRDLDRMSSAIGSNELSGQTIRSDAGKSALAALLMSAMTGTIDADEARQTIYQGGNGATRRDWDRTSIQHEINNSTRATSGVRMLHETLHRISDRPPSSKGPSI